MEGGIRGIRDTPIPRNTSPHIVPVRDFFYLRSFEMASGLLKGLPTWMLNEKIRFSLEGD